jgi:hypothetical protein
VLFAAGESFSGPVIRADRMDERAGALRTAQFVLGFEGPFGKPALVY